MRFSQIALLFWKRLIFTAIAMVSKFGVLEPSTMILGENPGYLRKANIMLCGIC